MSLAAALADRYRIERELGQGGMATVYLADDVRHHRKVAIKVLRPELAAVIGAARFLREIETIAQLQHPHILGLIDSGEVNGTAYYVMPFVEGESLRDRLSREKQLPVADALRIVGDVAAALDYAHRRGVIHRDIKPENIMLHDGSALVADFGISLAVSAAGGSTRMTETGMSLGTPHYMSPEQAMGEREITARSDVYALGAMTYEMLAGDPPFTGSTAQAIVAKVVTDEPPPLRRHRKAIPEHVESAVLTALEKLPADRFPSTKAFAEALANPHYTHPVVGVRSARSSSSSRWKVAAIAASLVAVVATLVAVLARSPDEASPTVARYTMAFPDSQFPVVGTLSRDGQRFLFLGPNPQGREQLWIKERDKLEATPIRGTGEPQGFTLSPDGNWVALVRDQVLRKVPISGGTPVELADSVFFAGVTWLDNGTLVFSTTTYQLAMVPENGGAVTPLWQPTLGFAAAMMMPLPGSPGVLFTLCKDPACGTSDLYVFDFQSDSARMLVADALQGFYLPTGHLAYVDRSGDMKAVSFDLKRLEIRGQSVTVLSGISLVVGVVPTVTVSATGTLIMQTGTGPGASQSQSEMVWIDRAGVRTPVDSGWSFQLGGITGNNGWSLSPDGRRVAINITTNSGEDVWIKQLPSGPLSRLTFDTLAEQRPRWTRDGRAVTYILFSSPPRLVERRSDGTGTAQEVLAPHQPILEGFRSPDNAWVVGRVGGQANRLGGRDIIGMRPGIDSTARPLVADPNADETSPALSPDGRWLAYVSDETGSTEVYIRPFPNTEGGKWQVSINGGQAPLWARSGRELFFVDGRRSMIAVPVAGGTSPDLGDHRRLFSLEGDTYLGTPERYTPFDISPDDRRFLMVRPLRAAARARPGQFVVVENWFEELKERMAISHSRQKESP